MGKKKIFNCCLISFLLAFLCPSCSCDVTKKETSTKSELPKIDKIEQQRLNDINILVDKNNDGSFRTSLVLNQDVSKFNTAMQENNPHMYIKSVNGNNIDDLIFIGQQFDCLVYDNQSRKFVCTFEFEVTPSLNWEKKNIIREVNSITYSIFNTEIISPVSVKIYESVEEAELINSSPIFKNVDFKTLLNTNGKTNDFFLALNWNYLGFNTKKPDENKKIVIKNLTFHYNLLKLEKAYILIDNLNGKTIYPTREDEIDVENSNYQLTSEQAYWSGNFLKFYVSFNSNDTSYKQISDFLEMEYSINDSSENKKVILFTIQLYDFLWLND